MRLCGRIQRWRKRWTECQWQVEEHRWVSSLTATTVTAQDIAEMQRGHWIVENGVFYMRDMAYG